MTETFTPSIPIWCAGCGDYAVRSSLDRTLHRLGVHPHETMILAGIGCSGTIQSTIEAYGYHALHGRVLPTATGVALSNPALTVVAAGGDGDGYAIGAGHLVHTFRRNPPFTYLLMNNGTYGLTKGQPSPTSDLLDDTVADGFDGVLLGLSITATTFLARAYCGAGEQLDRLMAAALEHAAARRGLAFLEVISPCVTYQDVYPEIGRRLLDLDEDPDHDPLDRGAGFLRCMDARSEGRIPIGLIYRNPANPDSPTAPSPAHADVRPAQHLGRYAEIMSTYRA
jgi:2-oxoglutarate ferredoxin oxidoreductase subunit beta